MNVPVVVLYKICPKNEISHRTLVTMATERKQNKNILLTYRQPLSLDDWCVALSSGPLPRLPKLCHWGQNCLRNQ